MIMTTQPYAYMGECDNCKNFGPAAVFPRAQKIICISCLEMAYRVAMEAKRASEEADANDSV